MVTREESASLGGAQRAYDAIYPALKAFSALDHLLPFAPGALLVLSARRKSRT
jgi:hypothetical protein